MPKHDSILDAIIEPFTEGEFEESLSESTRKARRNLLVVSLIGVLASAAGLTPTEVTLFGIRSTELDVNRLLFVLTLVIAFFLATFSIYCSSDYQVRKMRLAKRKLDSRRNRDLFEEAKQDLSAADIKNRPVRQLIDDPKVRELLSAGELIKTLNVANKASSLRLLFDIWVPLLFGLTSGLMVLMAALGQDVFFGAMISFTLITLSLSAYFGIKWRSAGSWPKGIRSKYYRWRSLRLSKQLKSGRIPPEKREKMARKAQKLFLKAMGPSSKDADGK